MSAPATPSPSGKGWFGTLISWIVAIGIVVLLLGSFLGPNSGRLIKAREGLAMWTVRDIALALLAYAKDHQGAFPDGATSTAVFQKLIDEKYATEPALFYLRGFPGKTSPSGNTLAPENVCFDVTAGITPQSSGNLPLVFSTGWKIDYRAGGGATRIATGTSYVPGLAVAFKDGTY